jgi:hypothetical protein
VVLVARRGDQRRSLHAQLSWSGRLTRVFLAPVNEADGEIAPILLEGATGVVLGDRNSWLPDLQAFLRTKGILLQAPFHKAHSPKAAAYQSAVLGRVGYLIDTQCLPTDRPEPDETGLGR